MPDMDASQDVSLIGYEITSNSMNVKFKRLKDTGDSKDKVINSNTRYSWGAAYHPSEDFMAEHPESRAAEYSITLTDTKPAADEFRDGVSLYGGLLKVLWEFSGNEVTFQLKG